MSVFGRMTDWVLGNNSTPDLSTRTAVAPGYTGPLPGVIPAGRSDVSSVDLNSALTLDAVYRAIDIIVGSVMQLDFVSYKAGKRVPNSDLVDKPSLNDPLSEFLEMTVTGLVGHGNAFWLVTKDTDTNRVTSIEVLNPLGVAITYDKRNNKQYEYNDKTYRSYDKYGPVKSVKHLRRNRIPGTNIGIGPIQACRLGIRSMQEVKSYGDNFFSGSGTPNGFLSSDQPLDEDTAAQIKMQWMTSQVNHEVAVLGQGTEYKSNILNPSDAQWIPSQKFNVQQIARLFGIPPTWLLAEVDGNSMTYNNQETVYIEFIRNTLRRYLIVIEDAMTDLTPNGSKVKFDLEGLLQPDSKTRAEINALAVAGGWKHPDEVRAEDGYEPLTAKQKSELKPKPAAPTPTQENEDD